MRSGILVTRFEASPEPPLVAIESEISQRENTYAAIIVSTFRPGLSRWLQHDLLSEINRRFQIPVQHVIATQSEERPISIDEMRTDAERAFVDRGNLPMA